MEIIHLKDCDIAYSINESKFMNMSILSMQSLDHSITIKISILNITEFLVKTIKKALCKKYLQYVLDLILELHDIYGEDILSIMVDGEFLHIDQLSSNTK